MNIQKFLSENNIYPSKELDQFFLKNESLMKEEVELADLSSKDVVLEIGAGFGNLTQKIAERCKVIAVEKDEKFIPFLKKIKNVIVVNDDIIHFLRNSNYKFNKIISNIPYSRSQDILIELLKHKFVVAVLIVQKEFAEKLEGKEKLSLLLEDCADVEIIKNVSSSDFYPKAVESSIVRIRQRKIMDNNLWNFLKNIYRNRNRNAKIIENCPEELAKKKIHQLSIEEIKQIINLQRHKKDK